MGQQPPNHGDTGRETLEIRSLVSLPSRMTVARQRLSTSHCDDLSALVLCGVRDAYDRGVDRYSAGFSELRVMWSQDTPRLEQQRESVVVESAQATQPDNVATTVHAQNPCWGNGDELRALLTKPPTTASAIKPPRHTTSLASITPGRRWVHGYERRPNTTKPGSLSCDPQHHPTPRLSLGTDSS